VNTLQTFWNATWRSILVALGYIVGIMLAGIVGGMLGWQPSAGSGNEKSLVLLFTSALLLGVFLGPLASRLAISRLQHFVLWGSLIIFNLGSVALEGAYFAPSLVRLPIPVLLAQQLLAALGASVAITVLFSRSVPSVSWSDAIRTRPWHSWLWRFVVSGFSYLLFYFVFGGLNYSLVTKPYYETHAGGLTVPAPEVVLMLESIRGMLIVFSVLLFLLSVRGTRARLMGLTGWVLFAIGGIIPLIWQIGNLPLFLLFASAIEIFFQNFLTGVVAAWLMGVREPARDQIIDKGE
jgi:hypothetical protein